MLFIVRMTKPFQSGFIQFTIRFSFIHIGTQWYCFLLKGWPTINRVENVNMNLNDDVKLFEVSFEISKEDRKFVPTNRKC